MAGLVEDPYFLWQMFITLQPRASPVEWMGWVSTKASRQKMTDDICLIKQGFYI